MRNGSRGRSRHPQGKNHVHANYAQRKCTPASVGALPFSGRKGALLAPLHPKLGFRMFLSGAKVLH